MSPSAAHCGRHLEYRCNECERYHQDDYHGDGKENVMDEMKLPNNKTCADCQHCERCCSMFGVKETNRECDFYPVRFVPLKEQSNG